MCTIQILIVLELPCFNQILKSSFSQTHEINYFFRCSVNQLTESMNSNFKFTQQTFKVYQHPVMTERSFLILACVELFLKKTGVKEKQ